MAEGSFEERTEQATPRRREEARKRGQIPKSREISSVMVLLTGGSVLFFLGSFMVRQISELTVQYLGQIGSLSLNPDNIQGLNLRVIQSILIILAPVLITVLVVSILSHYVQSGPLLAAETIKPEWSKINPLKGFGRLFSKQSLAELLKSIFKILIIGGVAYSLIQKEMSSVLLLTGQNPSATLSYLRSISWSLLLKVSLVMLALAGADYLFQHWSYEKNLRMTKQEVKEEMKSTEGDPLIKSRVRSLQRQLARRRMMVEVPKADVIITNPTHLAIALRYQIKEMEAPKVVAKGAGWIAEKIIKIAREHQIPLIENKPLAQTLYKSVEIGQMIPSSLYQVVADILAYVYRIKNKRL